MTSEQTMRILPMKKMMVFIKWTISFQKKKYKETLDTHTEYSYIVIVATLWSWKSVRQLMYLGLSSIFYN